MARLKNPLMWFWGLMSSVIGAFWGAIESGIALPAIDSNVFNYGPGLSKTLKGIAVFAGLSAIKVAATYLKQSPLPPVTENGNTTVITKPEDLQK